MTRTYSRGDMYYADLGEGIGSEQNGHRPVLIIQNNTGNKHSPTVIVAAISSKVGVKAKLPTHVHIGAECGLQVPSIILLEQLRTIDKQRLEQYIGRLGEQHIRGVNHALAISVGLIAPMPNKLTLCLCSTCADSFRSTGAFLLRRADPQQSERDICTYCNCKLGYDYDMTARATNAKGRSPNV